MVFVGILLLLSGLAGLGDQQIQSGAVLCILLGAGLITWWLLRGKPKSGTGRTSSPRRGTAAPSATQYTPVPASAPDPPRRRGYVEFRGIGADCDDAINALDSFVAVDVETTGLDDLLDRIVEIGIAEYSGGTLVSEFSSMVNPQRPISPSASRVNGITDQDVADAPTYDEIAQQVADRISGKILIAHNARFDTAFVRRLLLRAEINETISYIDTLAYTRRTVDGLPNYKLDTLVEHYGIDRANAHRALDDAKATAEVFLRCRAGYPETLRLREETARLEAELKKILRDEAKARAAAEREAKYHGSPLYNVVFAFTGSFSAPRESMEQKALNLGAIVRGNVSRNTDYLVVGDISDLPDWAVARKSGKADELIGQGRKVRKITESAYWGIISEAEETFRAVR